MATKSKRNRDYRAECLARIARGLASGKSRSQARGHARASDLPKAATPRFFDKENKLEKALRSMKKGFSQRGAAKAAGVSTERLRRFQEQNTKSRREGRRWIIVDERPVTVLMATRGKLHNVAVTHDASSDIGRHWVAINKFLETNDCAFAIDNANRRCFERDIESGIKMLWGERRRCGTFGASNNPMECTMLQSNDVSRSLAALNQDSTLVVVIEMGMIPGAGRQPLKKTGA